VGVTWTASADKHNIPHDEALYAMSHPHHVVQRFGGPRVGDVPPTLFIGPSRFGTLEVLAVIRPPADVHIFHVMPLRESTRISADHKGE
jgi:hypothetical protein